ncbi:MAG: hypothetical protein Q8933_14670 [Bacteroidota bacterium]|nr:hypothetical protein [Bacteroidota bacterium]MDP4192551.1 hypothetical protein [Bacteroidota bacterium]MDP4196210.1 hypothetical protein [Bacteroidota bacterium]
MKKYFLIMIILFSSVSLVSAQHMGMGKKFEKDRQKIEELERVKLIEVLNMNEDVSVKFFSRRKDYNDKLKDLNQQRDDKLNQIQKFLDENKSDKNDPMYKKQIDEVISIEKAIMHAKRDFVYSLKDILSYQQVAKYMVFERNFRRELRDLILKERKRN